MIKINLDFIKILKHCYSNRKWHVPKELLSTSLPTEVGNRSTNRSLEMEKLLRNKFPKAQSITVTDLSGNCGSMFEVIVVSEEFKELPLVKQHMLVTECLSQDIKNMHGIRIETQIPEGLELLHGSELCQETMAMQQNIYQIMHTITCILAYL